MNRLLAFSLGLHISGLASITALEAWRPGFISAAVNIGLVWVVTVVFIGLIVIVQHQQSGQKWRVK